VSEKYLTVTQDIPFGTVFAYRKGDKVAESAVEANGWQDYVASPTSKAAKEAASAASGEEK
jgi:hypothetical protein